MRTRAILTALSVVLGCCAPVVGCQIIAGLTALEVVDGGTDGGADAGADSGLPSCKPGTQCGNDCAGNTRIGVATCSDAGTCPGAETPCPMGEACLPPPMAGSPPMCVQCGTIPPNVPVCTSGAGCETCDDAGADGGALCVTTCDAGASAPPCGQSMLMLNAGTSPAQLVCNGMGSCGNLTVNCHGPFPCEIVCNGGCVGLVVNCDPTGPCQVTCGDMSCGDVMGTDAGGVTMNCGNNACAASCAQFGHIMQNNCPASCGCAAPKPCNMPPP